MKKLIWPLLMMIVFVSLETKAQSNKECKINAPAQKTTLSRGKNPFKVNPEQKKPMPEKVSLTRGSGKCSLLIRNITKYHINVFIDSAYAGYISPGKNGAYTAPAKGFSSIHCWTSAGELKWQDLSGCKDCKTTMILNNP